MVLIGGVFDLTTSVDGDEVFVCGHGTQVDVVGGTCTAGGQFDGAVVGGSGIRGTGSDQGGGQVGGGDIDVDVPVLSCGRRDSQIAPSGLVEHQVSGVRPGPVAVGDRGSESDIAGVAAVDPDAEGVGSSGCSGVISGFQLDGLGVGDLDGSAGCTDLGNGGHVDGISSDVGRRANNAKASDAVVGD